LSDLEFVKEVTLKVTRTKSEEVLEKGFDLLSTVDESLLREYVADVIR